MSSRSRKAEEWSQRLLRFSESQQTVVEFCRSEGISQPSFYVWRKKLKAINRATFATPDELAVPVQAASPLRFEPVSLDSHPACGVGLRVRLPGGIELELGDNPNVTRVVVKQLVESALQETGPQTC